MALGHLLPISSALHPNECLSHIQLCDFGDLFVYLLFDGRLHVDDGEECIVGLTQEVGVTTLRAMQAVVVVECGCRYTCRVWSAVGHPKRRYHEEFLKLPGRSLDQPTKVVGLHDLKLRRDDCWSPWLGGYLKARSARCYRSLAYSSSSCLAIGPGGRFLAPVNGMLGQRLAAMIDVEVSSDLYI
ncbi:unnamed protein product [Taenia asiatica]|uniref:Uncharacterized protein n=1 Tax=Taenia asiatica TaxID=60517 RepID=A0A3P6RQM9_TAEAS|nr:unnamed protein product [Taenia asiatica]